MLEFSVTTALIVFVLSQTGQSAPPKVTLPPITVTAQKEPADPNTLPVSVTTVTAEAIEKAGITMVSEAGVFAPNSTFTEFTARKLSNARMRGLGASPANPGVTTYFDGVPQLNANSSSIALLDVSQIEFVRGPQSALFGRNALGGLINVSTMRPSASKWTANAAVPFGNYGQYDLRASASGPIAGDKASAGFAVSFAQRDGFTINDVTAHDIDNRSAFAAKGQVLFKPASEWETRVIVSGERARDGDYALNDLAAVRQNPFHVSRDYEGHTDRDIFNTTILARREGTRLTFSSTTGFVKWNTFDSTDLDYTPLPIATRDNHEDDFQFTQEVRVASAAASPIKMSDSAGAALAERAVPLHPELRPARRQHVLAVRRLAGDRRAASRARARMRSSTMSGSGSTVRARSHSRSARSSRSAHACDHESKDADLKTSTNPPLAPPTSVVASRSFSDVSPQFAATFQHQAADDGVRVSKSRATRPAASTRSRLRAARRTPKSTRGTSRAA